MVNITVEQSVFIWQVVSRKTLHSSLTAREKHTQTKETTEDLLPLEQLLQPTTSTPLLWYNQSKTLGKGRKR